MVTKLNIFKKNYACTVLRQFLKTYNSPSSHTDTSVALNVILFPFSLLANKVTCSHPKLGWHEE